MTLAVTDAGPLIHLYEIRALHLLAIFDSVLVPPAVWQEATAPARVPAQTLTESGVTLRELSGTPDPAALDPGGTLHRGEIECLWMCRELAVNVLLTDDLAARVAAHRLAIQPVGSLGVIVRAFRDNRLSRPEAEERIRQLRNTTLFVTPVLVELAIDQIRPPGALTERQLADAPQDRRRKPGGDHTPEARSMRLRGMCRAGPCARGVAASASGEAGRAEPRITDVRTRPP